MSPGVGHRGKVLAHSRPEAIAIAGCRSIIGDACHCSLSTKPAGQRIERRLPTCERFYQAAIQFIIADIRKDR